VIWDGFTQSIPVLHPSVYQILGYRIRPKVGNEASIFSIILISKVGNEANTKFWKDRWLHGERHAYLVSRLFDAIPKWLVNTRIVRDAILSKKWVYGIKGVLSVSVLIYYLYL
jgi:hypothetical protein